MLKQTKYITLFSLPLLISGCVNSVAVPKPVVQTATTKAPQTRRSVHPTVSLGRVIAAPSQEVTHIEESVEVEEEVTTILDRADEDEYVEEEQYSTITEEAPLPATTTKEESMEIVAQEMTEEPQPVPVIDNTTSSKTPTNVDPYGDAPQNYREKIRNYLAKKANPSYSLKYIFSRPQKAYKNNRSWKGWMVQVDVLKRNGKGEVLKNQPYTILFNGSTIAEEIKSGNPKEITKVIY